MKNYKKLMAQHGGYIPFTALGGTKRHLKQIVLKDIILELKG